MPTTVTLMLRTDARHVSEAGAVTRTNARPDTVDLDQLTPRARALAEAVAQMPGSRKGAGEILCHHRTLTRRDTTRHPEVWLRPEEMDQPARQTWSAWDRYPADSEVSPVEYLERQARKIPHDWVIVSAVWFGGPRQEPVPSSEASAADRYLTSAQALSYMRSRGKELSPTTWRSYYSRKAMPLAPKPDRYVERTPQWAVETIDAFLDGTWKATA